MADNEQIGLSTLDSHRRELEGKIKDLDVKVDGRITYTVYFGILVILVGIIGALFGFMFSQLNGATEKINILDKKITVMKTQLDDQKKK